MALRVQFNQVNQVSRLNKVDQSKQKMCVQNAMPAKAYKLRERERKRERERERERGMRLTLVAQLALRLNAPCKRKRRGIWCFLDASRLTLRHSGNTHTMLLGRSVIASPLYDVLSLVCLRIALGINRASIGLNHSGPSVVRFASSGPHLAA